MTDPAMPTSVNGARPLQRSSIRDQLAAELKRLIITGAIPLGTALPSESQLSRTFRCSRPVVREALRDLEQMGLVYRAENGRELVVQPPPLAKLSDAVQMYVELWRVTFDELFECLELLDPIAARLAAERGDAALLDTLRGLNEPSHLTVDNLVDVEVEFHLRLAEASGNRLFVAAWKPILDALAVANAEVAPLMGMPAVTGTHRAHDEVIRAIAGGDPATAATWSRRHCAAFRRGLAVLGKSGHDPVRPLR